MTSTILALVCVTLFFDVFFIAFAEYAMYHIPMTEYNTVMITERIEAIFLITRLLTFAILNKKFKNKKRIPTEVTTREDDLIRFFKSLFLKIISLFG